MDKTQGQLLETLDRVEKFLASNREELEGVVTSAAHQNFSESRGRMMEHLRMQDQQTRAIRAGTATKRRLREQLIRQHMRRVSIVAKAQLPDVEEMASLTMPRRRQQIVALIGAAYGMAEAAKVHEASLLAGGLPSGFIDELIAATDALRDAVSTRTQVIAIRVEATAGLTAEATVARKRLRVLGALVGAAVKGDAGLAARWQSISHVVSMPPRGSTLEEAGAGSEGGESSTPSDVSTNSSSSPKVEATSSKEPMADGLKAA